MNSLPENFTPYEKLLAVLVNGTVDFAVVGGVAVALNGYVRATEDVDIVVNAAPANLRKLLAALEKWGEGWAREKTLEDFRPRLRYLEANGIRIPYLAPEDLIYLKEGSWREKDKFDVQAMREIMAREGR